MHRRDVGAPPWLLWPIPAIKEAQSLYLPSYAWGETGKCHYMKQAGEGEERSFREIARVQGLGTFLGYRV